jgi:[NiFe] hydrogenase assembly HybE family chaperone
MMADVRVEKLVAEYALIAQTRMKDHPFSQPQLRVEALDFTECEAGLLGALLTPWGLNFVLFPREGQAPKNGHQRLLPGGPRSFLGQQLETAGYVELSSVFSPMPAYETHEAAAAAARELLAPWRTTPTPPPPEPAPVADPRPVENPGRRDLFNLFRRR